MPLDQGRSRSLEVRQKLGHPVIDGDGHTQEYHPEPRVASIVKSCTDADTIPKPPWRARKQKYIAHLADAPALRVRFPVQLGGRHLSEGRLRLVRDGLQVSDQGSQPATLSGRNAD